MTGYGGGIPMLMAFERSTLAGTSSEFSSDFTSTAVNTGLISAPLAVPFMGNNVNNQVLADPGTESNMTKITPVGEGWWVILLLGMGYFLYYQRRNYRVLFS